MYASDSENAEMVAKAMIWLKDNVCFAKNNFLKSANVSSRSGMAGVREVDALFIAVGRVFGRQVKIIYHKGNRVGWRHIKVETLSMQVM